VLSLLLVLAACQKPDEQSPPENTTPGDTEPTATIDTFVPTGDTSESGVGVDTYVIPAVDCTTLSERPLDVRELGAPRGHHSIAFDDIGSLVGTDGTNLIKWLSDDTQTIWAPGVGGTEQMDYLPDGDLAVAVIGSGAIARVSPEGVSSVITTDVSAYGVTVGPDGKIWAGNNNDLIRIDPETGVKELIVRGNSVLKPRVISFNPELTKVYIGSFNNGEIFVADLDANYDIVGDPYMFAAGVGAGPYMDCLTVDECGNLYACDYSERNLYRITPDGVVNNYVSWNPISQYGHGVAWGSGLGGWSGTAIYLPQPYDSDTMVEVEIGVRSYKMPILPPP